MEDGVPKINVKDLINNLNAQHITRPKPILKNKNKAAHNSEGNPSRKTSDSDDETYDAVQKPPQKFSYGGESKKEEAHKELSPEKEQDKESDAEDTSSDEEASPEYLDFGQYLSTSEIVDETKNFLREEENYCQLLWDLIEKYINSLATDKFDDIFDVFGRIDLICNFQNNTFLPDLKRARNVVEIAECFIKHKTLFSMYYDHYFKNQQNMIFIMNDNKDVFKTGRPQEQFKEYENILLRALKERILAYNNFLESTKNTLAADIDVTYFDRALQILANLTKLFSPKDENIRFLISELIETERAYVEKLEKIIEHIIPTIRLSIHQQKKQNSIIGNVPLIYDQQLNFHKNLEQCLMTFDPNEVGNCFLQHKKEFMQYVKDQQMKDNLDAIDECREILDRKSERFFDFHAPLNRLYKYKVILQELKKSCFKGGTPFDKVAKAFDMITELISKMNGVAAINCIKEENMYLDEQGELILRDEFIVQSKNVKYDAMVFLFEKSIIFTEITTAAGLAKNRRDVFIYKSHIISKRLVVTVTPNSLTDFQLEFQKKPKNLKYILKAKDEKTKAVWIAVLKSLLMRQLEEDRLKHSLQ